MLILPIGDENPRRHFPFVNWLLILANIGIFAWMISKPEEQYYAVFMKWSFVPVAWSPVTLVTSMFLHAGPLHLAGNMLFLGIVGDNVEDRLGHVKYLFFYLAAGLAGGAAHWIMQPASTIPCVGASGAISGVMGGYLILFPTARIKFWAILFTFTMPAILAIGIWFLEQAFLQYAVISQWKFAGVAYDAHIGGFVLGFAAMLFLRVMGKVKGGTKKR